MKIEILGTGCYNCIMLEALVNDICADLKKGDIEILRISDEKTIRKFMLLDEIPGLVIDGQLVSTRKIPDRDTLVQWLSGSLQPSI